MEFECDLKDGASLCIVHEEFRGNEYYSLTHIDFEGVGMTVACFRTLEAARKYAQREFI